MRKILFVLFLAFVITNVTTYAIDRDAVEFGVDATINYLSVDRHQQISTKIPSLLRVGYFIDRDFALELRLATSILIYYGTTSTSTSFQVGFAYHFNKNKNTLLPFIEGITVCDAVTRGTLFKGQFGYGGGLGIKGHGSNINPRAEFLVIRRIECDAYRSTTSFQINIGFSFFTK